MPGTVKLDNGAIYPVGFENGSRVFSGLGMKVSDLNGSAVIHMPVKNYTYGWTGSIYQYFGNGWIEVPTVITKNNESSDGTASATIYYDGIYAVLVHYVAPIVANQSPSCPAYESMMFFEIDETTQQISLMGIRVQGDLTRLGLINGTTIGYTIVSDNPLITFSGATTGPAMMILMGEGDAVVGFVAYTSFSGPVIVNYTGEGLPYFTITFDTGECSFSYAYSEADFSPGDID